MIILKPMASSRVTDEQLLHTGLAIHPTFVKDVWGIELHSHGVSSRNCMSNRVEKIFR